MPAQYHGSVLGCCWDINALAWQYIWFVCCGLDTLSIEGLMGVILLREYCPISQIHLRQLHHANTNHVLYGK